MPGPASLTSAMIDSASTHGTANTEHDLNDKRLSFLAILLFILYLGSLSTGPYPCVVYDRASLYPSFIMAGLLCCCNCRRLFVIRGWPWANKAQRRSGVRRFSEGWPKAKGKQGGVVIRRRRLRKNPGLNTIHEQARAFHSVDQFDSLSLLTLLLHRKTSQPSLSPPSSRVPTANLQTAQNQLSKKPRPFFLPCLLKILSTSRGSSTTTKTSKA